jgi:hypothetical protein
MIMPGTLLLHHDDRVGRIGPRAPALADGARRSEKEGGIGESHEETMTLVDHRPEERYCGRQVVAC